MKIKLKTEGLTGDNLKFVEMLNARFDEAPEAMTAEKVQTEVRATLKGLIKEDGTSAVEFAKLTAIDFDKLGDLMKVDEEGNLQIRATLKKQGELIKALQELDSPESNRVKSVREQLKDFHEKNKAKLAAFKGGESQTFGTRMGANNEAENGIELERRDAATMGVTASSNGSKYSPEFEVVGGVTDITRTNQPFIEKFSNTTSTNRPRIAWTEKYNKQGNATFLAEGAVKQLISFEWRSFETYAKKVAAKIKVSTEALDDVDWLAAEIEAELRYEVDILVNTELLSGAGDGTSGATTLKGLLEYVGGYVLTTVLTTTPNNFDVLRAAFAQHTSLGYTPTHVFINPIDGANMDLTKDENGRPVMMDYKTSDGRLFRVTPIETNDIPVGNFLMGDMSKFKIRNYRSFAISYGWVNDDFERNLVTVLGERRLHCFLPSNHVGAFVYDTFANVRTAIDATV